MEERMNEERKKDEREKSKFFLSMKSNMIHFEVILRNSLKNRVKSEVS